MHLVRRLGDSSTIIIRTSNHLLNLNCSNKNFNRKLKMASSSSSSQSKGSPSSSETKKCVKNRLQYEKSPYLLQHQTNPVDWHPWSEESFQLAKSSNKPIFLSVGYSTCHWCHVMERESFENPIVAKVMNDKFVNIKMDREERPDVDKIYMTFVQAISGSGGWPMSVWMTPDLKPFYGGTYYPPDDRYFGRPGFKALLETISEQWTENEQKCHQSATKILEVLNRTASLPCSDNIASADTAAAKCVQQLTRSYEPAYGGFSEHPKFPQPVNLIFLMDWSLKNSKDSKKFSVVKMVETTLKEMAKGGIHDHVGQGFARYSTDKKWHVPHFEKMLYDQAQLTVAYSNAYLLTKNELYANIVKDILIYVGRDLGHPEGGFYSAEDADSHAKFDSKEKKEGAFYVWMDSEIDEILGSKHLSNKKATVAEIFKLRYGVKPNGNVDPNSDPHDELKLQNVLFEATTIDELAKKFEISVEEVVSVLDESKVTLFNYRNVNRPRPGLDTKFVTSWNGLMISGFAKAGMALRNPEYISRAAQAMDFLVKYVFVPDGKGNFDLKRTCYRDDKGDDVVNLQIPILGCVDDFANLVAASLELFHATSDIKYLKQAVKLQEKQDALFWDNENGGYFTSRGGDASVLVRMKDDDDGAEPSSNSTSSTSLIRLHSLLQNDDYLQKAEKLFKQFSERIGKVPITLPVMTAALTSFTQGPFTVIQTRGKPDTQIHEHLLPLASTFVTVVQGEANAGEISDLVPHAKMILAKETGGSSSDKIYAIRGQTSPKLVSSLDDLPKFWE